MTGVQTCALPISKHLPTAIRAADQGPFARTFVAALKNSGYFTLVREAATEAEAQQ